MSRKLKPYLTGVEKNNDVGVTVEIYLDRETKHFFAHYSGKRYADDTEEKVKRQVREAIKATAQIEWVPLIYVKPFKPFMGDGSNLFGFTMERFWVGRKLDGGWAQAQWGTESTDPFGRPGDHRREYTRDFLAFRDGEMPSLPFFHESSHNGASFYLAYDDALWENLGRLYEQIGAARTKLQEMLGSPQGVQMLTQGLGNPRLLESHVGVGD